MTHAELLRKHATDATNEGGVWFSGEYMSMLATVAESLESENAKLHKLCADMLAHMRSDGCEGCVCKRRCDAGEPDECVEVADFARRLSELGIEVGA